MRIIVLEKKLRNKLWKNKKKLLGVFPQVKIGLKRNLSAGEIFFRKKPLFKETPPNNKKMGSKSENRN